MAEYRNYRDRETGAVGVYPVSLAKNFPRLVEVEPDAKPLAYVPIPRAAREEYLASASKSDEVATSDEEDEA